MLNYLHSATWFSPVRFVLSLLYQLVIALRNGLYDTGIFKTHEVSIPVISVGNISVGGSGKTILVQALLDYLLSKSKTPVVLSRGYGRTTKGLFLVSNKTTLLGTPSDSGDEPFLIAKKYPGVAVVVSEDRVVGANYLVDNFRPDVILLDDGFQHRRLHRDLDLVILDQADSPKPRHLPWGKLREPYSSCKRADLVLYSKAALRKSSKNNLDLILEDHLLDHRGEVINNEALSGDFGLFAGLGNPAQFFASIQAIYGASIQELSFPDHSQYGEETLKQIARLNCNYWITTEKDFVKLDPIFCEKHQVYYIKVSVVLPEPLLDLLKKNFNL